MQVLQIHNSHNKNYLPDPFITGLLIMIFLAWLFPGIGMGDYFPNLGNLIDAGIFLIFFFYGLKLNPEKIREGMSNWRMHFIIQMTTFIFFPLLVLPFYPAVRGTSWEISWMAVFYLSVLPSTVSSSVVMTGIARGNVPGAIFNASLSGLLGILVTPLWMGMFLVRGGTAMKPAGILLQLFIQIILPVILGLMFHSQLGKRVNRYLLQLAWFDKSVILLIVYESFSKSFRSGIFRSVNPWTFAVMLGIVILLFFTVFGLTARLGRNLHFNREDRITLQFAGTKKSLVHGTVFANVLFAGMSGTGILLLPIMMYHAFQLFFISLVAIKRQKEAA